MSVSDDARNRLASVTDTAGMGVATVEVTDDEGRPSTVSAWRDGDGTFSVKLTGYFKVMGFFACCRGCCPFCCRCYCY